MFKKMTEFSEWLGIIAIILAYFLLSFNLILAHSLLYLGLNLVGSAVIVISSFSKKDYQPGVLNIFWLLITIITLFNWWLKT
ncbi:MAG: hypothetical protein WCW02_01750 [Candidatus Buchananbacteria bacterium]